MGETFNKVIASCLVVLTVAFLYHAVREYVYKPFSEEASVVVKSKACNIKSPQKINVELLSRRYVVDVSREFCWSVSVDDQISLYYSGELDKVFQSRTRNLLLSVIAVISVVFSLYVLIKCR
jgi:hypothetical protein